MGATAGDRQGRRYSSPFVRVASACVLGLALAGCASDLPQTIRVAPAEQPDLATARTDAERLRGRPVRWGGELVELRNLAKASELEILARRLDSDGEPDPDSAAQGRFIARVAGFVDPADFKTGDRVTVAGVLAGTAEGKVGDFVYRYPVVAVRDYYRWPERVARPAYGPYPWPYYDPWWPYRPYGWPYPWW